MTNDQTVTLHRTAPHSNSAERITIPLQLGAVRLIEEIGRGGMGVVWLGHDQMLGRNVAVKFLLNAVAANDEPHFAAFLEGARLAAAVKHSGLTTLYHADLANGVPFLVMEYIDGPTLGQLVRWTGPLALAEALAVLEAVSSALGELHDRGIVHRDLKPANVLLDRDGHVFVTDFGLASLRLAPTSTDQTALVAGTPAYMAPEMFDGLAVPRSDVYALGVMTYELLTGWPPFSGSLGELMDAHRRQPLPLGSLRELKLDETLISVIERAIHKDAPFRYKTARHFLRALHEAIPDTAAWSQGAGLLAQRVARLRQDSAAPRVVKKSPSEASSSYYERLGTLAEAKSQAQTLPASVSSETQEREWSGPAVAEDLGTPGVLTEVQSGDPYFRSLVPSLATLIYSVPFFIFLHQRWFVGIYLYVAAVALLQVIVRRWRLARRKWRIADFVRVSAAQDIESAVRFVDRTDKWITPPFGEAFVDMTRALIGVGRAGESIRVSREPSINVVPLMVTFEPRLLDETDSGFAELDAASTENDAHLDEKRGRGRLSPDTVLGLRRTRKNLEPVVAWIALAGMAFLFLDQVPDAIKQGRLMEKLAMPSYFIFIMGIYSIPALQMRRWWKRGRKTDQWLVVPGGILDRRAEFTAKRSEIHLFDRRSSVLCVQELTQSKWSLVVADRDSSAVRIATQREADFLLRAWLSPLPPPPIEQLIDYA